MATLPNDGGTSVPPTILPFPDRGGGRHREVGMDAAGFLSLLLLDRDGEAIPTNVQRFDEPEGGTLPSRTPELLLAMLVWSELPAKRKENVRRAIRCMAYADKADPSAVQLNNLLSRRV